MVPDRDAADLKFRSGELDGLDNTKPENYRWYQDNQEKGNFTLYDLGPDLNTNFLWFNLNTVKKPTPGKKIGEPQVDRVKYEWFKNPVFRRAVSMAIDRQAMIPSVFFGEGHKNWAIATPANKIFHSPDLVRHDYNIVESKKLLASLGFKDGNGDGVLEDGRGNPITFTLKTNSDNTLRIGLANFVKDDLAKVGINVVLAPVEFNTIITNLRADFQYDAILLGLQSGVPPDPAMMQNVYRSSGLTHFWNIAQPKPETPEEARIDQLMDEIICGAGSQCAQEGVQGSRDHRQRAGVVHLAADRESKGARQQPFWQHSTQHPSSSNHLERRKHLRQMKNLLILVLALVTLCYGMPAAKPLKLRSTAIPIRFRKTRWSSKRRQSASTAAASCLPRPANPRTFNGMMANETSSTDITTRNLFTFLVDYDNGSPRVRADDREVVGNVAPTA